MDYALIRPMFGGKLAQAQVDGDQINLFARGPWPG